MALTIRMAKRYSSTCWFNYNRAFRLEATVSNLRDCNQIKSDLYSYHAYFSRHERQKRCTTIRDQSSRTSRRPTGGRAMQILEFRPRLQSSTAVLAFHWLYFHVWERLYRIFIGRIRFFTHACESIDFDNQALRNQILVNVEQKKV